MSITEFSKIASQWSPDNTIDFTDAKKSQKYFWNCSKGHTWEATLSSRIRGRGCPYCGNKRVLAGYNDLMTTYPKIADNWDYDNNEITPKDILAGTDKQYYWKCDKGHSYLMAPSRLLSGKRGCNICAGKVVTADNSLHALSPHLLPYWDTVKNGDITPHTVTFGSSKKVWWIYPDCKHSFDRTPKLMKGSYNCPHCWASGQSSAEGEVVDFIRGIVRSGISVEVGNRVVLGGKELDIYIPELNVAVEFNGLYWHSEEAGKDRHYHYNKWVGCRDKGIQLITVWEDDWRDKNVLVKRMLEHKLGHSSARRVFARKTSVGSVSGDVAGSFLKENHIQGRKVGCQHIGLYERDGNLVSVLSYQVRDNELMLERFATSEVVVGGFTKLLKVLKGVAVERGVSQIVTFADHDVSDGGLYRNNGFEFVGETDCGYWYVVNGRRVHRFGYRKEVFRNNPLLKFEEGLSERELAGLNGFLKIHNSGNDKFVLTV